MLCRDDTFARQPEPSAPAGVPSNVLPAHSGSAAQFDTSPSPTQHFTLVLWLALSNNEKRRFVHTLFLTLDSDRAFSVCLYFTSGRLLSSTFSLHGILDVLTHFVHASFMFSIPCSTTFWPLSWVAEGAFASVDT
jgi:hypothetical protein